ncbi:MAG: FmdB family transcriptional regulator [Actinobacteria bacterium]|jgi:putative FmdB family regulatory protein|nr:FmdB family transcriptional regulator [Actinomycetota bacterium]
MPTYEYTCKKCGEHLEIVQSFKDDPLSTCPSCGGSLRKVFGSIGIVFKGSGFYKTDNRASKAKSSKVAVKGDTGKEGGSTAEVSPTKESDGGGSPAVSTPKATEASGSTSSSASSGDAAKVASSA